MMSDTMQPEQAGLYCSTAGTYFTDKDALSDHYKSDFHRYNLKRKISDLPPVTREWFEARKEKLAASSGTALARTWMDPLTRKKFGSENTYSSYVGSRKYKELVRQSGQPAPAPVISMRRSVPAAGEPVQPAATTKPAYTMKAANGVYTPADSAQKQETAEEQGEEDMEEDDDEGWETASDEVAAEPLPSNAGGQEDAAASTSQAGKEAEPVWEEWDVRRSLFDNHVSSSMETNLEYMWKRFGFYLPEADLLTDPEGLLKYLGAKLQHGHMPLYVRGDDASMRTFPSLHAVQRHMADTGRFKPAWEGNEDEYEDFYNFEQQPMEEDEEGSSAAGTELAVAGAASEPPASADNGYEVVVGGNARGEGGRILGHRAFARYYRQKYRGGDSRRSVAVINSVLAKYHELGIVTQDKISTDAKRSRAVAQKRYERNRLRTEMNANVNRNLPRNVPY